MDPFPLQWKDTIKNRKKWRIMQSNEAFIRKQPRPLACHYCDKKSLKLHHWREPCGVNDATVDHVVPLARGGSNDERNKVVACRACNLAKGMN